MNLHLNSALPLIELERSRTTGDPQMPVFAPGPTGEVPLASDGETTALALCERLLGGHKEVEFQHAASDDNVATNRLGRETLRTSEGDETLRETSSSTSTAERSARRSRQQACVRAVTSSATAARS
jgi:hypothetical protein